MNPFSDQQMDGGPHASHTYAVADTVQHTRQEVLENAVLPMVQAWSLRHHLEDIWEGHPQPAHKRLYACAFSGITRTLDPHHLRHAWILACFSWWVSVLDYYLDHDLVSFVKTRHWSLEQQIACMQAQLALISTPLTASDPLFPQPVEPVSEPLWTPLSENVEQHTICLLKDALADLCMHLQHYLSICVDEERRRFASTTVFAELKRFMRGQERDVSCTLQYHATQHVSNDLEAYLEQLRDGVGLRAVAALSLACEAATVSAYEWNRWLPALEEGSQMIRLINDCGGFMREQAEGKPNSITIALATLGYPITTWYTPASAEVVHAVQFVKQRLDMEQRTFRRLTALLLQEAPLTPLSYCIISAVTSIARLYQAGADYEVSHDDSAV